MYKLIGQILVLLGNVVLAIVAIGAILHGA